MLDPWDRDGYPRVAVWPYENFLICWNYSEPFSPRTNPYFGVLIAPWILSVDVGKSKSSEGRESFKVSAKVTYPCFQPFDCSKFPANNVLMSINFPMSGAYDLEIVNQQIQNVGSLMASKSATVIWEINCLQSSCSGVKATVTAQGLINGYLPPSYATPDHYYSSYSYVDLLGASTEFIL